MMSRLFRSLKWVAVFSSLLSAVSAGADIYNYDYWWPQDLQTYFADVNAASLRAAPADVARCGGVYRRALERGEIDVRYALGYFDDSKGHEIIYDGRNYGLSPSLDITVFNVIRGFLTQPCVAGSPRQLCGFSESGRAADGMVVLTKAIRLAGRNVNMNLRLTHASASESFVLNQGELRERQRMLTAQSEENYFGGIGRADVVFYNGHSRNGGGPDFNPPRLNRSQRTDYDNYYEVHRPGITRALELIRGGQNREQLLGFFSCYSRRHFQSAIDRANPSQRVIYSSDDIDYRDALLASMGYLEGLMQGRCGQDLADLAKQGTRIRNGFQGYNIR